MNNSVFFEFEFWLLVACSIVIPAGIYSVLLKKRAISHVTVLFLGVVLVLISGLDVYLMQTLKEMAKHTTSAIDDRFFVSELSIGFYLIPALFGGVGVNLVSHVLIRHLNDAENQFEKEHSKP